MNDNITVLYVDDEKINIQLFALNFRKKFNVITAENGISGLELLSGNDRINAVVSDMKMPYMSGIEFITKAKESYPDIPFFILTGFSITEEISNALKEELIKGYFTKPLNIMQIESAIVKAL